MNRGLFKRALLWDLRRNEHVSDLLFGKTAVIIGISFVLLWLYAPSLHFHFWYDDFSLLYKASVASWKDIAGNLNPVQPGWGAGEFLPFYRPLSQGIYFGLMRLFFGLDSVYYHGVCLVLLGLISFNVYLMTLFLSNDKMAGFFASVLFATATTHGMSQLWISATQELLVVFLMTASFLLYLQSNRKASAAYRACSAAIFVLALLSKETAVVLPGLLFLVELLYARPGNKEEAKGAVVRLAPFALIAMVYVVFRMTFFDLPQSGPYKVSLGLFAIRNLGRYFLIAVNNFLVGFLGVPYIDILHKVRASQVTDWGFAWVKFSLVAIAVICLVWSRKWDLKRDILFSMGWFALGLLPTLFLTNHFYFYYLLPAIPGMMLIVGRLLANSARVLHARSPLSALTLFLLVYALILTRSTLAIRKEQDVLGKISVQLESIEEQLTRKLPNPQDESSFIFSGDYHGGWWRDLTPAIQIIYDNPNLYAADIGESNLVAVAMNLPYPVYLVHVRDGTVHVSRKK